MLYVVKYIISPNQFIVSKQNYALSSSNFLVNTFILSANVFGKASNDLAFKIVQKSYVWPSDTPINFSPELGKFLCVYCHPFGSFKDTAGDNYIASSAKILWCLLPTAYLFTASAIVHVYY